MRYETEKTRRPGHPDLATDRLARGLGVFSIALGLAELVATRALARAMGMRGHETLLRTYGLRELAAGIGILSAKDPTPWVWSRVAGDALDIGTLVPYVSPRNRHQEGAISALAAVIGVTALDIYCGLTLSRETKRPLPPARDYSDRTGFSRPIESVRGAARDVNVPEDMRPPESMRPFTAAT